ncbi:apoptosis-resistant E3 ubiquitin protein ligase 1-like isoform X2 [Symsagittifera roscoffensis]|uniref:apoptosis-resistant E3 ubiquitin protein ligase 1-like isoform X2 n=1 Tax=Symsagittifera roscoffensis TaxID=84072 RepID=UPI00307C616D
MCFNLKPILLVNNLPFYVLIGIWLLCVLLYTIIIFTGRSLPCMLYNVIMPIQLRADSSMRDLCIFDQILEDFVRQYGLLDHLRGEFFDETKSELQWGSVDEAVAGDNHYFDILLFKGNRKPLNLELEPDSELVLEQERLVGSEEENEDDRNQSPISEDPLATYTTYDSKAKTLARSDSEILRTAGITVNVLIEFQDTGEHVRFVQELAPEGFTNVIRYSFRPKRAGEYSITVLVNRHNINGSRPHTLQVVPGEVCCGNVRRTDDCSVVLAELLSEVVCEVELRDRLDNVCSNYEPIPLQMDVEFQVTAQQTDTDDPSSGEEFSPVFYISKCEKPGCCTLNILLQQAGCFRITVKFQKHVIQNGLFQIIFLNDDEKSKVDSICDSSRSSYTYFKAALISSSLTDLTSTSIASSAGEEAGDSHSARPTVPVKTTEVYCHFTSRYLVVAKYKWLMFRKVQAQFRLTPSTKMEFLYQPTSDSDPIVSLPASQRSHKKESQSQQKSFLHIEDGIQLPVNMYCQDRNVLAACFVRKMLKNIGGSESFKDKREHFKKSLEQHCHRNEYHTGQSTSMAITVKRDTLVDSSMSALSRKDYWSKLLVITFQGEQGQDCGGVRREWLSVLCAELFGHQMGLFGKLCPDDPNSPLHPVGGLSRSSWKYMEFAGKVLAKSLLESTICPQASQASLPARLTKSFIAQIMGLRVNISHLEVDEPELYRQKVQYILENDVTDLELTFSEEDYDPNRTPSTIVHNLIPRGSSIAVTNENKKLYLDKLVQFKLVSNTKTEVDEFRKGFESVVPTDYLAMFSENEVELMLCGVSQISVADFQAHCTTPTTNTFTHTTTTSTNAKFNTVLQWFWTLVESMTQEELGKLLQFITGSCRLPVGGFRELQPHIEIKQNFSAPCDHMPVAHTCFNRLLLPTYSSNQTMHKMVLLALNEGSAGFGLS